MNRRNVMDYLMRRKDGRNPYGSRGGYVDSQRDRNMRGDYGYNSDYNRNDYAEHDYRYDYASNSQRQDYANNRDYEQNSRRDMGTRYPFNVEGEFGRYDGHYPYPHYPMMYDYNMDYRDRGRYDYRGRNDYGDMGETLGKEELEKWKKRLMKELEEKDKQFFTKEMISQKARTMGIKMDNFNEEELLVASLMMYTDYCKALKPFVGSNMEIYIAMAKAFLTDEDASVKGGEKLAVYHDCIVEGEDDD